MNLTAYHIIKIAQARLAGDVSLLEKWADISEKEELLIQQAMEELED